MFTINIIDQLQFGIHTHYMASTLSYWVEWNWIILLHLRQDRYSKAIIVYYNICK